MSGTRGEPRHETETEARGDEDLVPNGSKEKEEQQTKKKKEL